MLCSKQNKTRILCAGRRNGNPSLAYDLCGAFDYSKEQNENKRKRATVPNDLSTIHRLIRCN